MLRCGEVWIGHREDNCISSISYIAEYQPSLLTRFPYAHVAILDSGPPVRTSPLLSHAAVELGIEVRWVRGGFVISGHEFVRLAHGGLLTGFDEVWFFDDPPVADFPDGMRVAVRSWLSECSRNEGDPPADLLSVTHWMRASGAVLALADGAGLDYISVESEIAVCLEAM
ncbi:MAG: hypothetical protein ACYC0V_11250 [Armatimonadota bacterium]